MRRIATMRPQDYYFSYASLSLCRFFHITQLRIEAMVKLIDAARRIITNGNAIEIAPAWMRQVLTTRHL